MKYTFLSSVLFLSALILAQDTPATSPDNTPSTSGDNSTNSSLAGNIGANNPTAPNDNSSSTAAASPDPTSAAAGNGPASVIAGNGPASVSAGNGSDAASPSGGVQANVNSTTPDNSTSLSLNDTSSNNASNSNSTVNGTALNSTANSTALNATNSTGQLNGTNKTNGTGTCRTRCRRREIRSLSPAELKDYFNAVKQLMSGPSPTKYDYYVGLHIAATKHAHSTAYFLPWHRGYLVAFEKALQEINPKICVPYWNWSFDSQAPEASVIFTSNFFGSNGDNKTGCVTDGIFAGWKPANPTPHCLQRKFRYSTNLGAFQSFEGINEIVTKSTSYSVFRDKLEMLAHPTPHTSIGGDMAEMHSPNDPIFWCHHAYIDYIWSIWQKKNGKDKFDGPSDQGKVVSLTDQALGLNNTYANLLDNDKLCYNYVDMNDKDLNDAPLPPSTVSNQTNGNQPNMTKKIDLPANATQRLASYDRTALNIIRIPDTADEDFCKKNGLNVSAVRNYEDQHKTLYQDLNKIDGYVSPSSLWKRPSLSTKVVQQQQQDLCVDIEGVGRIVISYDRGVAPQQALSNVIKRAQLCSPNIELPPEKYQAQLQKLVGAAAFDGAGSQVLKKVNDQGESSALRHFGRGLVFTVAVMLTTMFY